MLSIKEQLMVDMKEAMKAKEDGKTALSVIRMARAHIRQAEIDSGHADFDDDQVIAILRKEVKQRKETLAEIEGTGRDDLVEGTQAEIAVLQKYLPADMTEEAIRAVVTQAVEGLNENERNMGTVMKVVMAQLKGKADGKVINSIVRDVLS